MPFSTISSWVLLLAKTLDSHGLDSAILFREAGLDPDLLKQAGARFPTDKIATLWHLAQKRTRNPAVGLELARRWHPTSMHALGYSWMASRSLRDAIGRDWLGENEEMGNRCCFMEKLTV